MHMKKRSPERLLVLWRQGSGYELTPAGGLLIHSFIA